MIRFVLALLVFCFTQNSLLHRFEDYPVTEVFGGAPAKPDFASNPKTKLFRSHIIEGASKEPNFAGHYRIVWWGCGSNCQTFVIVDSKSGRIFGYFGSSNGMMYRKNSRLIIVNPITPERMEDWKEGGVPDWGITTYYLWKGKNLAELDTSTAVLNLPDEIQW